MTFRFDLDCAQHHLTWQQILDRVRYAETAGFEGAWVFDHFQPLYGDLTGPCLEGWTLLAALAQATTRVRLGTLVTGITYRLPSVLAAEAVTVDHVSGGRLEMGLGAAWNEREHRQLGIPFPGARERIERLEEAIVVLHRLLAEEHVDFDGRYYQLRDASYRPRPVQQPHPPLWIGGSGERRMLPLIARQADVWHAFGAPEELARKSALIDEHARAAGRDPGTIRRSTDLSLSQSDDDVRHQLDALGAAGITTVVVSWPGEGQQRVDQFVEKVLPEYRQA